MGYRSSVRCLIYGDPEQIDHFISWYNQKGGQALTEFDDCITTYTRERGNKPVKFIDLEGDGLKWYEDYADVQAWHGMLQEIDEFPDNDTLREAFNSIRYEFRRAGEDLDDTHWRDSEDAWGHLSMYIVIKTYDLEEPTHEQYAESPGTDDVEASVLRHSCPFHSLGGA